MERQLRLNIMPDVAHALVSIPQTNSAIMRIYNKNRPKFFAAAQASPLKNSSVLKQGRAEHQIMSMRVLGILSAGTEAEINMIFRAADRKCYDRILEKANRGETIVIEENIDISDSSDAVYNKIVIFLGWCSKRGVDFACTQIVDIVLSHIAYKRESIAIYKSGNAGKSEKEILGTMRLHLGFDDDCIGIGEFYNVCNDRTREFLEPLCRLFDMEDMDAGTYTDGIPFTRKDAAKVVSYMPRMTAINTFLLLLIRAIKKDKEFCLNMYRDDKIADMESAYIERDKSKQELDAARKRIRDMEALLREKERECEEARKEIGAHRGDADEIASLRNALYRATRQEDVREEKKLEREIPQGTIGIGGHPSWARDVSKETGIKIWPQGTTCPQSVLSSASEVWIQPAYMDHSSFYAAIRAARKSNVPVRYFSSTGVARCVLEMRSK